MYNINNFLPISIHPSRDTFSHPYQPPPPTSASSALKNLQVIAYVLSYNFQLIQRDIKLYEEMHRGTFPSYIDDYNTIDYY